MVAHFTNAQLARASARVRADRAMLADDNRALGSRLDGIVKTYPHLNAATAMALADAGYDNTSVEVKTVGNLQAKADTKRSAFNSRFAAIKDDNATASKSAIRTMLSVAAVPYEAVQGMARTAIEAGEIVRKDGFGAANKYLEQEGSAGDVLGQTRFGAAAQVAREADISIPQALNNGPRIGRDGDPTSLLERNQQTWFSGPNSLAERRQVVNARAAGTTGGRATTFGRAAGAVVGFEPGGAAHSIMGGALRLSSLADDDDDVDKWVDRAQKVFEGSIDFAAVLALDPVGRVGANRARQVQRGRSFSGPTVEVETPTVIRTTAKVKDKATGITSEVPILTEGAPRKSVVFKNAEDWILRSKKGDGFATYAAKETDYARLASVLGRNVPPSTVLRIIDEADPTRVKNILLEEVGKGAVTVAPKIGSLGDNTVAGIGSATLRGVSKGRWAQLAPSEAMVSREDPAWAVEQYRRMQQAMRTGALKETLTPEFLNTNLTDFARALSDDGGDWSVPYKALADVAEQALVGKGVRAGDAQAITRIWGEQITDQRNFWIDRNSGAAKHAFVTVDGEDMPIASASASAEMFTDGIPLLDTVALAKAASRMRKLYENPGWQGVVAAGDGLTAFFKFMVLPVRGPAWMIRNLTEAQARITVRGLDGAMSSPLDALAWRVGDNPRSTTSRLLGRRDREKGRGAIDSAGDDFRLRAELEGGVNKFARSQEHKGGPWMDEQVLYTDQFPIVRRSENMNAWLAGNRFTLGKLAGSPEYRMVIDSDNGLDGAVAQFMASPIRRKMAAQRPELATREGATAYMQKVMERIDDVTNGNPALRKAIRTGQIDNIPLVVRNARGNLAPNPKAELALEKYADDLPEFTVAEGTQRARSAGGGLMQAAQVFEKGVFRSMFALFGSVPNNRFVNSPLFRELHWKDAVRLAPLGTAEARAALIVNARKANMPKDLIKQLDQIEGPPGTLDAEDIRDLADTRAFEGWMDIVYNSHNKGNWTRSVRMISPFAAAVADMYRFWGKSLVKNPLVLHRVEQGFRGARQSGFFYTDENGDERFAYPMTRALSQIAVGVDKGLSGTVKGANMITSSVIPSVGPIVSWPAGMFIPERKETDTIRELINPYGDPDASGGILEGIAPGHVQRILAAVGMGTGEQKRRYQESLADTMAYLASTGDYGNSADEQARLAADAKRKGQALYLIQAMAQSSLPASPRGEFYFKDPSGRAIQMAYIAADYRKMMTADPETATQNLLAKYGEAMFLAVTGGTTGTQALATEESYDLARENPQVLDKYSQVWSFFTDPNSPYSHAEFRRQIKTQERLPKTLRDRQVSAQTSLAASTYYQYKSQFGPFPTTEERAYLQTVKSKLRDEFPLWSEKFDVNAVKEKVKQAFAAAEDPVFKDTPVAKAVRAYQQARQQVVDDANGRGLTSSDTGWGKAKTTEEHRDYLRQVAATLIEKVPGFELLWQRVFDSEMVDDVEGQP